MSKEGEEAPATRTVEELVDEGEVAPDAVFRKDLEVRLHQRDKLAEKLENQRRVGVFARDGDEVEVAALHVEEAGPVDHGHGRPGPRARMDHLHAEGIRGGPPAPHPSERCMHAGRHGFRW